MVERKYPEYAIPDMTRIPQTTKEIQALAEYADERLKPETPEFLRIVKLLNIAERRILGD